MGNLTETFRKVLKEEGLTQKQAAEIMGLGGQPAIIRAISYGISFDNLYKLCKPLGYRIVLEKVQPNGKVKERYELEK